MRVVTIIAGLLLAAWAGVLLFFTGKDDPYGLGAVFSAAGRRPSLVLLNACIAASCLAAAALLAAPNLHAQGRFFWIMLALGFVTAAAALPALASIIAAFRRRPRALVVSLLAWLPAAAVLYGIMAGAYVLCEIISGLRHFRL